MWQLKGLQADKPSEITKALNDGWEPFSVVNTGKLKKNGAPIMKVYFRRKDPERELIQEVANELTDFLAERMDRLEELIKKANSKIDYTIPVELTNFDYRRSPISDKDLKLVESKIVESESNPTPDLDITERDQYLLPNEEELAEQMQEENPHGYKVVDDIPEHGKALSPQQESSVDAIRKNSKTNITVNPVSADGNIVVIEGALRHTISKDGSIVTEDTGAHTNSIGV